MAFSVRFAIVTAVWYPSTFVAFRYYTVLCPAFELQKMECVRINEFACVPPRGKNTWSMLHPLRHCKGCIFNATTHGDNSVTKQCSK